MITVEIHDKEVLAMLRHLGDQAKNMAPALSQIGEALAETTRQRFDSSTAPDGSRWQPNARATIEGFLARRSGGTSKRTGKITAKGASAVMNKRPLVETGGLADSINWRLIPGGVAIGTNRFAGEWSVGAAVHQFGSTNGRIPARPFLGISAADRKTIEAIIGDYLLADH